MSVSLIPESAPFNEEQRAWLNGFIAGWTGVADGLGNGQTNGAAVQQLIAGELPGATGAEEEAEEFPWHDSSLEMDERLKLAEGKPVERRLMAAMAQLDCGACGYLCQTYSEAIAAGDEKSLTLCSPGGKETAKMLKKIIKEDGGAVGAGSPKTNGAATNPATGYTRSNPFLATIKASENLNKQGSSKHTAHVEIVLDEKDLKAAGLDYHVGDALGVFPTNCPELIGDIAACLGFSDDQEFALALGTRDLRTVSDELLELLAGCAADTGEQAAIEALVDSDEVDDLDVLDVLRQAPSAKPDKAAFLEALGAIAPRLYSIASSIKSHPGEVHLTVGRATAKVGDREYKGVASTMFADRVGPGDKVGVYVHKSHGFTVPADPSAPMVMVGPGTGVAPFRAFLEERQATKAPGMNWLFFGDQHAATDFLYQEQLSSLQAEGVLTRLSTAFSRDQEQKVYVQDRMREEGAELWKWLDEGGYFFVCGDAKRMALDVDKALHDVVVEHGRMSMADAMAFVRTLKDEQRYVRDVY